MMWFGPGNSVIVPFDYRDRESFVDFEEQLTAIQQHYKIVKLSQLVDSIKKRKRQGLATIALSNPRKGVMLQAVSALVSLELPFVIFLDPDLVGLNRLPMNEELRIYQEHYPELFSVSDLHYWLSKVSSEPGKVDEFLKQARSQIGPLPVDHLDSLQFFSTWGKLIEISPELVEFGFNLDHQELNQEALEKKFKFFSCQLKGRPRFGRCVDRSLTKAEEAVLRHLGIEAVLTAQESEINRDSDLYHLPIWNLL